jgi:tetratricopeptide (TPR) repeat protein
LIDKVDISAQIQEMIALAAGLRADGKDEAADEIVQTVESVAALHPDPAACAALAHWHFDQGRAEPALAWCDRALALQSRDADTLNLRGAALNRLGRFAEARAAFEDVLRIAPQEAAPRVNLAAALQALGLAEEALNALDQAIALDPTLAAAQAARGNLLSEQGREVEAITAYDRALALDPSLHRIAFNRGCAHLLAGDPAQGWRDLEARARIAGALGPARTLPMPRWDGEDLNGRTVLLHCEQGMGDALMFIRYAPLLQAMGARVVLESFQALAPLLRRAPGVDQVIIRSDPLPQADYHLPLMSLPLMLRKPEPWSPGPAYLTAPSDSVERWTGWLGMGLKVGLTVSGNPAQANDHKRSVPLAQLTPALPLGPTYVLLQKDVREADRAALAMRPDICLPDLGGFSDTAALTQGMDLVITVCTATAHLAGALGKPFWLLSRSPPDWRWGLTGDESAWYPSARIYRQAKPGDWSAPAAAVGRDLETMIGGSRCGRPGRT